MKICREPRVWCALLTAVMAAGCADDECDAASDDCAMEDSGTSANPGATSPATATDSTSGGVLTGGAATTTGTGAATGMSSTSGGTDTGATAETGELPPEFDPTTAAALQKILEDNKSKFGLTAVTAGVRTTGGAQWQSVLGVESLQSMVTAQPDNQSKIGSISKTFTGTVILKLIDQERISLKDRLDTFIGAIGDHTLPEAWGPITIEQLLYHTSGIPNYVHVDEFTYDVLEDPERRWDPSELVGFVIDEDLDFSPGMGWNYSNTGYVVLSLVAQAVTGRSIESLVHDWVIEASQLGRTSFPSGVQVHDPFNHGYLDGFADANGDDSIDESDQDGMLSVSEDTTYVHPSASWCAGSLLSTIPDLLDWGRILAEGDLLSPQVQAARLTWIPISSDLTIQFGLGVVLDSGFIGHQGAIYGYEAIVMHQGDTTFAVLTSGAIGSLSNGASVSRTIFLEMATVMGLLTESSPLRRPGERDGVCIGGRHGFDSGYEVYGR